MPQQGSDGNSKNGRYSDELKTLLLRLLERRHKRFLFNGQPKKMTARHVARALNLCPTSSSETRRRCVRALVHETRSEGAPIASDIGGYWLATEVEDFAHTERFLKRMGLGHLVSAANIKHHPGRDAAAGQLTITPPLRHVAMSGAHDIYLRGATAVAEAPTEQPAVDNDGYPIEPPPEGFLFRP